MTEKVLITAAGSAIGREFVKLALDEGWEAH